MNKLVLILLAMCSIVTAYAQPKTVLAYGDFSANTDNQSYDGYNIQNSQWFINPGVGYQIDKRWTVGIQGTYGQSMMPYSSINSNQTANTTDWTAGVFIRYTRYFKGRFSVYGQVDLSNAQGTYDINENGTNTLLTSANYVGFRGNIFPALSINIYRSLALNFNVGGISYSSYSWTNHPTALKTDNKFNMDFGHALAIGISKNFATEKKIHGHHEPGEDTRRLNTKDDDDDAPKAKKEHKEKNKHHKGKKGKKETKQKDSDEDDE